MLDNIKIAILNDTQNIWFIRASSGKYARHFRKGGVIAIKHLEDIYKDGLPTTIPSEEEIRTQLHKNPDYYEFKIDKDGKETKSLNRSGHSLLNQIKRFANEIKVGDLIVTKNEDGGYSFGMCSDSTPYIDKEPIKFVAPEGVRQTERDRVVLKYQFRKKVTWGPSIPPSELPGPVRKATRGQQTVTKLTPHREKIYHLIYPFFTDGESLYFSNKIKTKHAINALAIGKLFQNVSLSEALLNALLENKDIDPKALSALIEKSITSNKLSVTCQAEFMSPGDMWCKIPLLQGIEPLPQILAGVLAFLIMTGQVDAAEIAHLQKTDTTEILSIKHKNDAADSMFNDKFKPAETSSLLKKVVNAAKEKSKQIKELEDERSVVAIRDNLKISVTETKTDKLENFSYGINVIQIGTHHESN
ncbi:hypothetical protein [Pseudomonas sp. H9]|uniref:hypothetical protein n=1 Tax=Pseudomonas sp. H9 TaxID=483968 RepID=UPI001057793C|nr:hypothetical protein [Pseudomonas sp. H9]TDF78539.1 hypothetical protein E1573_22810 [Pseudomonas sp. H9]